MNHQIAEGFATQVVQMSQIRTDFLRHGPKQTEMERAFHDRRELLSP